MNAKKCKKLRKFVRDNSAKAAPRALMVGLARAHRGRQAHQPIAFDSRLLRIGAEMGLAKTPAVEDDFVARLPGRV